MDHNHQISRRSFLAASAAVGSLGLPAFASAASAQPTDKGKNNMDRWQIGCFTRPWAAFEYKIALDHIAGAGFKYVGLMTTKSDTHLVVSAKTKLEDAHQVGQECKKRNLRVASIYGGDFDAHKGMQPGIAALHKLIDNCAAAGSPSLLLGGTGNKDFDIYYKIVAKCCDYAAEKKLAMVVKPHGGLNSTGPQCRKCIEQVNHPNFRLWYDPGNIFYYSDGKLDPVDDAPSVNGLVTGMCVKDFLDPKNVELTPGTGRVRFPAVMQKLAKGGFTHGPLIIECLAPQKELPAITAEAKKARQFVEQLVKEA